MKTETNLRTSTKSTLFLNAAAIITAAFFLIPGSSQARSNSSHRQQPTQSAKATAAPAAARSVATNNGQQNLAADALVAAMPDAVVPTLKKEPAQARTQSISPSPNAIAAGTYAFTSASGAALEDMSSGTTVLLAADLDDTASAVAPVGFDFWFDGVRQTLFSVNANGLMRLGVVAIDTAFSNSLASTTDAPKIAPYHDDLWIGNNGKVHYKVVGTAPNRKLVVEWQNEQIPRVATATAGAGTFQAWLYESTGKIEFVYGTGMAANATNSGASVGLQSGAATNFASVTTSGPTVSYATANDANTGAITAGTKYTFTPNIPADPGALSYTAVGLNTMTLNWADNATNEFGYAVYRSVDGTNYEFIAQTAANATTYVATGLASNTTYFWKVFAVSEGGLSANAAARPNQPNTVSQATTTGTLSGTQSVGPTGTYLTLTAAVAAINTSGLAGNLILELQAAYVSGGETFPLVVNSCGSPSNTITIRPESGATGLSITSANATATLDLNGATAPFGPTNVIIDGRAGGTGPSQLTIANTVTTGVAVRLINGASRNTIKFCAIQGVNTSTTGGVVLFSTSGAVAASNVTGNNNNTIDTCDVKDGATTPVNGLVSIGSASTNLLNTGDIINNCNISNFFSAGTATRGLLVTTNTNLSNTGWTITNNRIFQTAARVYTTTNTHAAFLVVGGNDYNISGNVIGFANSAGTGTYTMSGAVASTLVGMQVSPGSGQNSIQGNTIAGISLTTTSGSITGLSVPIGCANIGTITGNTIGSGTGNGSITLTTTATGGGFITGLNVSGTAGGTFNVSNNTIGSLTNVGSATLNLNLNATQALGGLVTFSNNLIGSTTTANSIQTTTTGVTGTAQQMIGLLSGTTLPLSISNNTFANLTNAGTGTAHVIRALQVQSPGVSSTASGGKASIVANSVHDITGSNANIGAGATNGIFYSTGTGGAPNGGIIDKNTVFAIKATNAGAVATIPIGIVLTGASTTVGVTGGVVSNNKVYNIQNASTGVTATTPPMAVGIFPQTATTFAQVVNNMVSLGNAQTTNTQFVGIWNNFSMVATLRSWFNSVHIEGAAAAGALPSYGFLRGDNTATSAITAPVDIKNNIFDNTRTGGTGKHYAIGNVNTTPATGWGAGASNNNVLNSAVAGTVGIWGLAADQTFAGWKSISSCDGASVSGVSVVFVDAPNGDLHVNFGLTPTALESGGTTLAVTTDFDNQTRPGPAGSVNGGATAPDIGADEFDGVPLDITPPSISYAPLNNTISTANRAFTGVTVTDATGVNIAGGTRPRVYYKKSSDGNNTFNDNTSGTTGWKFAEANGVGGSPFDFTIDYSLLFGGSASTGDTIQYFVVAQDTAPTPNVAINSGTFTVTPSSVALTAAAFPIGGSINSYTIVPTISGTKTIGATGADYVDLTSAINALNNSILNGPLTFLLIDASYSNGINSLQAFPIVINANPGSSAINTVTIKPAPSNVVSISVAAASGPLIKFNGASYMTIDGSNSGGSDRSLTLENTSVTFPSVVWIGSVGATTVTDDAIKNCVLRNGVNTATAVVISDAGTLGNSGFFANITIQNNSVQKALNGVFANGGTTPQNGSNLVYAQNDLSSSGVNAIRNVGLYMQGVNGATVSQNTIGNFNNVDGENDTGIWLATGTINATVSGNTISALGYTGTSSFAPIGINVTSGVATTNNNLTGNTISNISSAGATFSPNLVSGITVSGATDGVTVQLNNIQNVKNPNTGTYGAFGMRFAGGNNHVVKNNFVSDINHDMSGGAAFSTTFGVFGISVETGTGHKVYYNSVNLFGAMSGAPATSLLSAAFSLVSTGSTSCDVRDNIFANNITGGTTSIAAVSAYLPSGGTSAMNLTWNNNAYYFGTDSARQGVGQAGTTAGTNFFTTLVALKAYSSTLSAGGTNDNASLASTAAVPFVSSGNLHLSSNSVPVANAGTPIAGVTADFDGNSRSATLTDIGADEVASADLSNLTLTAGALVPPFDPATTSYTISVPNGTTSTTVTPTVLDSNATVTVNGNPVTSGTPSGAIALAVGPNTITVIVTPEFGPFVAPDAVATTKTYTVTVTRAASSNADLSNLVLSAGAIVPAFDPATTSYTLSVPNSTTSTTVTPTTADATATVTVNGNPVTSGSPSGSIALAVGPNTITTVVTAQDSSTKTYTVTVTRAASSNADLSNLVLSAGAIVPAFSPATTSYTLSVPYTTTSTTVTPTAADPTATITVNGNPVASGSPSGAIALAVGPNVITTVVTAQDTTTMKTYTVTVTRAAASSNADLSSLVLSNGTLTPAFTSGNTSYTANVPNSTSSMTVTPTAADATATIAVRVNGGSYSPVASGSPSGSLALNVGANTIDVQVSAQDETRPGMIHAPATIKTYTVTVTRAAPASSNADLSNLTINVGTLTPAFASGTFSYTDSVPFTTTSAMVTPTAADAGATIEVRINGGSYVPVTSGSPSGALALNVGANTIDTKVTAADTTTIQVYTITVTRGAQVVVSGSTGADGSYATVKLAFDALNANGTQAGNVIGVSITGDTAETAAAVLNQPSVSSWTSLTITPSGARTVSGSLATPLIDLNGADNVTINGLNASGNSLTISNASTSAVAGTSTVRLINGATSNLLTNCSVLGSSTSSNATAGGNILISTSTGGTNSGNTISNNDIGPAGASLPSKCVMSLGSASPNNNAGNIIDNNNVFDFFNPAATVAGINIQTNNATVTISNNRVYQTAARAFTTAALTYNGILVTPGSAGSATITGNTVGFGSAAGAGTTTISGLSNRINAISVPSTSTTVATSIQNNRVSGFNQTTSQGGTTTSAGFIGITVGATAGLFNIGGTIGNNVGSLDGSSSIVINNTTVTANTWACLGIFDFSFQSGDIISNNGIGTITINNGGTGTGSGFRGIRNSQTGGVSTTISNNTIGGSAAGSITDNVVGTYNMYGIDNISANLTCTGNLIRNMVGNANAAGFISLSGIIISTAPTGASTISQNTIHSLSDNAGAANSSIYALYGNLPAIAGNVVERNFVHSLSITSTNLAAQLAGILAVAGNGTYKNNMVRLGIDASGASITPGYTMYGMFDVAGTNNFYYNSVYIGGSGVASSSNTFAFVSNVTTNTRNYVDNIFWNARSNASGGGKNYAISVAGTTPNPAGLTSNYNDLFASGTGGFVGLFNATDQLTLANWRTATGQDANSISADAQFVNPNGMALVAVPPTVNLHITCASPADGSGTPVAGITTDFDNDTRNATTPDIGADEINLTAPTPVSAVSSKVHGPAGPFTINLPFAGNPGIESRSGGATGVYQVIFTFSSPVTVSGAVVSAGTGSVSLVSGSGTNTITVDLTGVTNAQYLTVKLLCVDDTVNLGSVSVKMGVLVADAVVTGQVDSTDVSQVKFDAGSAVDGTTFRSDVNANGAINATDVSITKLQSGTALPP